MFKFSEMCIKSLKRSKNYTDKACQNHKNAIYPRIFSVRNTALQASMPPFFPPFLSNGDTGPGIGFHLGGEHFTSSRSSVVYQYLFTLLASYLPLQAAGSKAVSGLFTCLCLVNVSLTHLLSLLVLVLLLPVLSCCSVSCMQY